MKEKMTVATILVVLLFCMVSIYQGKPFAAHQDKILKTFVLLGLIETLVAVLQLLRIFPSFNLFFRFTGTFLNPAVFAMMIAICLSICVFYAFRRDGRTRHIWCCLTLWFSLFLIMSESRTCMIAGVCSSLVVAYLSIPGFRSCLSNRKTLLTLSFIVIATLTTLYFYKRDSADGRMLMWTVSLEMIAQKPLFGWGVDGFASSYMPMQATFLQVHPSTRFAYLADNISHPFNEFLLFGVKYGLIWLALLLSLIILLTRMVLMNKDVHRNLYLGILSSLVIMSLFSYPFQIPFIWMVSTFFVCYAMSNCFMKYDKMRVPMLLLLSLCFMGVIVQNRNICHEWQWHRLQVSRESEGIVHEKYAQLYKELGKNPSFLYNYGAWLHHNGYFEESLGVLTECKRGFDDYNVELLIADDYKESGETDKAASAFLSANAMIPSRFLPLYQAMVTCEEAGDYAGARRMAGIILGKHVKIEMSLSVKKIRREAEATLQRLSEVEQLNK